MNAIPSYPPSATMANIVITSVLLSLLASCSPSIKVVTRFNPDVDYKEFESFSFAQRELSLRPSWVDGQIFLQTSIGLIHAFFRF